MRGLLNTLGREGRQRSEIEKGRAAKEEGRARWCTSVYVYTYTQTRVYTRYTQCCSRPRARSRCGGGLCEHRVHTIRHHGEWRVYLYIHGARCISPLWQPLTYFLPFALPYNSSENVINYDRKSKAGAVGGASKKVYYREGGEFARDFRVFFSAGALAHPPYDTTSTPPLWASLLPPDATFSFYIIYVHARAHLVCITGATSLTSVGLFLFV